MLDMLNELLWGKVLLVLLVGVGVGFTVRFPLCAVSLFRPNVSHPGVGAGL